MANKSAFPRWWPLVLLALLLITTAAAPAPQTQPPYPVTMYLFWGDGCPHCAKARPYLATLPAKYPGFTLQEFEVYKDKTNQALFIRLAEAYGLQTMAVPTMFVGPYYLQGYAEGMDAEIESLIGICQNKLCEDKAGKIIAEGATIQPTAAPPAVQGQAQPSQAQPAASSRVLTLPLIGQVSLEGRSALASTVLISIVDGFNPCSIWVLSMLLALTLHTGSRRKVFIIGLVFLTVTAAIYALFILGIFSALTFASSLGWIQAVVAAFTLFFAVVNIKDYFWYKQGISFTIDDSKKPGIYQKMRGVINASQSLPGMIGATIVLSAGVSLVEFSCTAGFPLLWANLMRSQQIAGATFAGLLLLYMLIYQADEMLLFGSAVITLRAGRFEEKHGRLLKLVSGTLMFALSLVMLLNPSLMNDLGASVLLFGLAFAAALVVHFISQRVSANQGRIQKRHHSH